MKEKEMINCRRCGKCCLANLIVYVTAEDWKRWKRQGREDILHIIENQQAVWAGDHLVSAKNGEYIHGCPFLVREKNCYVCTIYETRPWVCRNYIPASSELCPQYRSK
ncbi:MAG: YkgJ family cysteine cluster protein [Deltaproteobacteria bacterium]|nr:YkgJ family cysteine cluster protein [Deltaproteobacteria bacterium]